MKKSLILLGALTACLALVASITFAQQGPGAPIRQELKDVRTNASNTRQAIKGEFRNDIKELKSSSTAERKQTQDELKNKAEEYRKEIMQKRDEAKKEAENNREEFMKKMMAKKLEIKDLVKTKRVELLEKLKVVKDEKKKEIVLNVGDQFQQINAKTLSNLTGILTKEGSIIQKISSSVDAIEIQGGDVTALRGALALANSALSKAREAIIAQTAKVYTINIKTESGLKSDIGITKQLLEKDLHSIRETVKTVHEAIKSAVDILENTPGVERIRVSRISSSTASSTNQ